MSVEAVAGLSVASRLETLAATIQATMDASSTMPPRPSSRAADRLDDGRLERLPAHLRYPQPCLAGLGLQAALVVPGAGIATRVAALIGLRIAQPIRLGMV
jgi:hypothetical protein